jgi:hypothetical protein
MSSAKFSLKSSSSSPAIMLISKSPALMLTASGSMISISMASSSCDQFFHALGLLVQSFIYIGCHVSSTPQRVA